MVDTAARILMRAHKKNGATNACECMHTSRQTSKSLSVQHTPPNFLPVSRAACRFTAASNNNSFFESPATFRNTSFLTCPTLAWNFPALPDGDATFALRKGTIELTKTSDYVFKFLQVPVWSADTPNEGKVFVSGVHCPPTALKFTATTGKVPLRMTMTYTLLRPKAGYAFVQKDASPPGVPQVLRNTERLQVGTCMHVCLCIHVCVCVCVVCVCICTLVWTCTCSYMRVLYFRFFHMR